MWRIKLSTHGPILRLRLSVDSASQGLHYIFQNRALQLLFHHLLYFCTVHILLEAFFALSLHTHDLPSSDHSKVWFFFIYSPFS